jgi:hypothetical protein
MAVMPAVWMPMMAMDADGDGAMLLAVMAVCRLPSVEEEGSLEREVSRERRRRIRTKRRCGGRRGAPHNISGSRPTSKPYST